MLTLLWNLLFILILISGCSKAPEPTFNSKPLSHWIDELYQYNEGNQLKAIRIISNMKTQALPAESDLKQLVLGELAGVPSTPIIQNAAVRALRMIGADVTPFDTGKHKTRQSDLSKSKTDSLSVQLETLIIELYTDDPDKQSEVIQKIGAIGPDANSASDLLQQIAEGSFYQQPTSAHIRKVAAKAMKQIELPTFADKNDRETGFKSNGADELLEVLKAEYPTLESLQKALGVMKVEPKHNIENTRTRIEVLIDSARMVSWLGDEYTALNLLHDILQIDTLSSTSRKKVVKTMEKILYRKEGISVKSE